jgi:DNA polymerase
MDRNELLAHVRAHVNGEWADVSAEKPVAVERQAPSSEKAARLNDLAEECKSCRNCELYKTATNLVFFDGSPDAGIVFIGEAPGADEDAQGKPFVGRAGKLLTATIEEMGLPRRNVYICNILKHRPPDNRNPLPHEIEACTPFLVRQLEILQPRLIITLGNFSTRFMLKTEEGITKLRGRIMASPMGYQIMPTYHPAAVLRNMGLIGEFKNDIRNALDFVK